jgi:hypothetical protein
MADRNEVKKKYNLNDEQQIPWRSSVRRVPTCDCGVTSV